MIVTGYALGAMEEYFPAPERRYPSPSAQRRSGEHWKARFGLATVVILTLCSAAVLFRVAGLGVGAALSPLRGPAQGAAAQPTAVAVAPNPSGQQAAAPATGQATPASQSTVAPTTPPAPTTRPGQREHTVQGGDTLFAISQRYNTSIEALVAANNLPSRNATLSIGQKLIIP